MSSIATSYTANELLSMPDNGQRLELVKGDLRMMSPAGNEHGRIASELGWRVSQYIREHNLGATFAAETGFIIATNPDTVRAPDFAFITQERIDRVGPVSGFWPGAPDIVAEVVSPNETWSDVNEKSLGWIEAGTKIVWVVDPRQKKVTVYRSQLNISVLDESAIMDAPDLLPGLQINVADLFAS